MMKIRLLILVGLFVPMLANAAGYCGDLKNTFGPFDFRKISQYPEERELVESTHFTPSVENLIKGNAGTVAGDLDYTLRAFPNHIRALVAMAKLALKTKDTMSPGMKWSFDCYFDRAMRFAPDDAAVHTTYGTYLLKRNDIKRAVSELELALTLNPKNAVANYNLGLIYLRQNNYDKARTYAKKAYSLDYPIQGLKNSLVAASKWDGS